MHSLGLNIRLPHQQLANPYLDINQDFDRFSDRLDTFVSLSDVVVVWPVSGSD
jgi:predicted Rossmann-fold nucleotide-binding protein